MLGMIGPAPVRREAPRAESTAPDVWLDAGSRVLVSTGRDRLLYPFVNRYWRAVVMVIDQLTSMPASPATRSCNSSVHLPAPSAPSNASNLPPVL